MPSSKTKLSNVSDISYSIKGELTVKEGTGNGIVFRSVRNKMLRIYLEAETTIGIWDFKIVKMERNFAIKAIKNKYEKNGYVLGQLEHIISCESLEECWSNVYAFGKSYQGLFPVMPFSYGFTKKRIIQLEMCSTISRGEHILLVKRKS